MTLSITICKKHCLVIRIRKECVNMKTHFVSQDSSESNVQAFLAVTSMGDASLDYTFLPVDVKDENDSKLHFCLLVASWMSPGKRVGVSIDSPWLQRLLARMCAVTFSNSMHTAANPVQITDVCCHASRSSKIGREGHGIRELCYCATSKSRWNRNFIDAYGDSRSPVTSASLSLGMPPSVLARSFDIE
jgi:hypothetical protein